MIHALVTIKGEPDTHSQEKEYCFANEIDQQILSNSVERITKKVAKKMRINVNEVLLFYLNYFIGGFRSGKNVHDMKDHASTMLSIDDVMIGVSESLKEIKFEIIAKDIPKQQFVLVQPIVDSAHGIASRDQ
ncbi:MAG TPA: urease subunit gamma [Nitrososphaeraceae archaeon]